MNLTDETVLQIAATHNASAAQVILAYLISQRITPIPSSRDAKKILDNFGSVALSKQLLPTDIEKLAGLNWDFLSTTTSEHFKALDESMI